MALIVGLGAAADLAGSEHEERSAQAESLRQHFLNALEAVDYRINGDITKTQSHVLNISFVGVDSEALMLALRYDMAISNGSACSSAGDIKSHVLRAMGLPPERIESAVRISWGRGVREIPVQALIEAVNRLKC